jgi:mono/diheme cytochrome c family protein
MRLIFAFATSLWMLATWTAVASQRSAPAIPPLIIESMTGRDTFAFYCASCHGLHGKGDGPTAAALKTTPADLTLLARKAGGTLARTEIEAFVTGMGRPIPAHGSGDMPVWGPIFRALDPSDARVRVRIGNLVDYLQSIQAK